MFIFPPLHIGLFSPLQVPDRLPEGIYADKRPYLRPQLAAVHLIQEGERIALVDTGTNDSLGDAALDELGYSAEQVDYILLTLFTSIAGGAGLMMQHFPNAPWWSIRAGRT